jgi:hypothetical protein
MSAMDLCVIKQQEKVFAKINDIEKDVFSLDFLFHTILRNTLVLNHFWTFIKSTSEVFTNRLDSITFEKSLNNVQKTFTDDFIPRLLLWTTEI